MIGGIQKLSANSIQGEENAKEQPRWRKVVMVLEDMAASKEELWRLIAFSAFIPWRVDIQILLFPP